MNSLTTTSHDPLTQAIVSLANGEGVSQNYRSAVAQYSIFLGGQPATVQSVRDFKEALEASNFKPSTVTLKVKAIKSLIRKAMALDGSMTDVQRYRLNRELNEIKCTKNEANAEKIRKKTLSKTQLQMLMAECKDRKALTVIKVVLSTAARISEVLQLTHEGLILDNDGMRTQEGIIPKGKKDTIDLSISDDLYQEIREAWETNTGLLFDVKRVAITNRITRAVQKTLGVHCIPHSFRHTFATLALRGGLDLAEVSAWLNHASSDTTARYYLHGERSDEGRSFAESLIIG